MDIINSTVAKLSTSFNKKEIKEFCEHSGLTLALSDLHDELMNLKLFKGKKKLNEHTIRVAINSNFVKINAQLSSITDLFVSKRFTRITVELLDEIFRLFYHEFNDAGISTEPLLRGIIGNYSKILKLEEDSFVVLLQNKMKINNQEKHSCKSSSCSNNYEFSAGEAALERLCFLLWFYKIIVNKKTFMKLFKEHSVNLKVRIHKGRIMDLVLVLMLLLDEKKIKPKGNKGIWAIAQKHLLDAKGNRITKTLADQHQYYEENSKAYESNLKLAKSIIASAMKPVK